MKTVSTVTLGPWNVSFRTGFGITGVQLHVFRHVDRPGGLRYDENGRPIPFSGIMVMKGTGDGLIFPDEKSATKYALDHGFLQEFVHPWCPIHRTQHTYPTVRKINGVIFPIMTRSGYYGFCIEEAMKKYA